MSVVTGFAPPPKNEPQVRLAVAEAWGDVVDLREPFRDEPYQNRTGSLFDRLEDRARGEDPPRFRTEADLSLIRGTGRFFAESTSVGIAGLSRLGNYTFGSGFIPTAQAATGVGDISKDLLATVQSVVDTFNERNKFIGSADRELDKRARRDGEAVIVLDRVDSWQAEMRFAEPACLTEPVGARQLEEYLTDAGLHPCDAAVQSWSFGVQTHDGRHERPYGYHFVWSADGYSWDWVPASRVQHVKRNVDRGVKRGVSDFYVISDLIANAEKLRRNTTLGAAIQAAIPFVKQFAEETTNSQAENIRNAGTTRRSIDTPAGRREVFQQHFGPGTIPLAKSWKFVDGPGGDNRIAGFCEALHECLRAVGNLWDMTEAMITGDASNNNFASALAAESPFVKAREADQQVYLGEIRSLYWKVIRIAYDAGRFARFGLSWLELQCAVFLKIDVPKVATRDRLKENQANQIEHQAGVLSGKTWAAESGRDYEAEVDAGAKPQATGIAPVVPAATDATPAAQPSTPAMPIQDVTLNGAQIQAAVTVLQGVQSGSVAPLAAVELLVAVGIDRDKATAMANATKKLPAPQVVAPAKPATTTESIRSAVAAFRDYP